MIVRAPHKVKQLEANRTLPGAPDLKLGKTRRADNLRQQALVKLEGRGRLAPAAWKKKSKSWERQMDRVTDAGAGMARNYAHGLCSREGRAANERRQWERVSDPGAALVSLSGGQRAGWGGGEPDGGEYRQWRKERVGNVMREGRRVIGARTWWPLESRLQIDGWCDEELGPVARAAVLGAIACPGSMVPAVGERLDAEQMLLLTAGQWRVFFQWAGWTAAESARLVAVCGLSLSEEDEHKGTKATKAGVKGSKVERRVA